MIRKFKRLLSLALVAVIGVCAAAPASVSADAMLDGDCGASAYWAIFSDNVLAITGSSATNDYGNAAAYASDATKKAPWADYYSYTAMNFMQKVVIANGITKIGDYIFYMNTSDVMYSHYNIKSISLPDSLVTIGAHAFENEANIQNIAIPQNVTSIGEGAFEGCLGLETVNIYCDPNTLTWDLAKSGLPAGCVIHLKSTYDTVENNERFADYNPVFNLTNNPNTTYPNKRLLVSYENVSSSIFGGAHPYSIKLVDEKNNIWPITYGSRGFPTCVKYSGQYYMVTDNSGNLYKINLDSNRANGTTGEILSGLSLKISNEYIGNNSVKILYTVKNTGSSSITFDMGSSGDIQIGTDDRAEIKDINYDDDNKSETADKLIGISMTSTHLGDKDSGGHLPTLGFVGCEVGGSAADADYFYGAAAMDLTSAATAVKADRFIPERIFTKGTNSISSGGFTDNADSGLSFHWDGITLAASEEKQYAVMFSVPYTESAKENETVIKEVESNIGTHADTTYITEPPNPKTIFLRNEQQVGMGDALAAANGYTELQNFLLLGVQRKPEMTNRNCLRYVTVVNTNILKDADEYGYLVAKVTKTSDNQYVNLRPKINQVTYGGEHVYQKNIKGSSNEISGDYGIYEADTSYKYVTLGVNDVPDNIVLVVRFYVKKGDNDPQYADYYPDLNNKTSPLAGCSADWASVIGS